MPSVLIIDSETSVAAALGKELQRRGIRTEITSDGVEGLKAAKTLTPDVIVLCVELARGSGYSICNKLKKDPDLASIPLMLTSSQATEETFEQHKKLRTRAEAYLKKPFANDQVLGFVAQHVDLTAQASSEVEVNVDEVLVQMGDDDDSIDVAIDAPDAARASPASAAAFDSELEDLLGVAVLAKSAERQSRPVAPTPMPKSERGTGVLLSDAEAERLRSENQQLRQKIQRIEAEQHKKELEFNDRLLAESTRARESVDLKKKAGEIDRELAKYKQAMSRLEEKARQAAQETAQAREETTAAEQQRQLLSDKLGQLVDKVKSLAAERDALSGRLDQLQGEQSNVASEATEMQKIRDKARKAIDIALQLLDETGLAH